MGVRHAANLRTFPRVEPIGKGGGRSGNTADGASENHPPTSLVEITRPRRVAEDEGDEDKDGPIV
jgi:hypothetical protein